MYIRPGDRDLLWFLLMSSLISLLIFILKVSG